jgi:hypothetical protein
MKNYPPEVLRLMLLEYNRCQRVVIDGQQQIEQIEYDMHAAREFITFYEEQVLNHDSN